MSRETDSVNTSTRALILSMVVIVVSAVFGLLIAFPIMWCWNYAVAHIWNLPHISWGQAWCLNFLSGLLIRSTLINNK